MRVARRRPLRGVYLPPILNLHELVQDQYYGEVEVAGITKAPIPWPGFEYDCGQHKGLLPILCGDLVRAVATEQVEVVAYYWGVTRYVVERWRQALAGCTDPHCVFAALAIMRADPVFQGQFGGVL